MYSPSQTKTYSRCQYKWFLHKILGVQSSYVGKRDLAAAVGTAVGAAVQASVRGTFTESELIQQAQARYEHEVITKCGTTKSVLDSEEAVVYPTLIAPMVKAFLKAQPIPKDWVVTHAESPISDSYDAYIDLAGTCPRGLWVADVKCRMNEKKWFMNNSVLKYQFDNQLSQYCREWKKRPGNEGIPLEFYRIIYIVGSPEAACIYQDFEIDWEYMRGREISDERTWNDMSMKSNVLDVYAMKYGSYSKIPKDLVYQTVPMASDHMEGFYKCDMWDACLTYAGNVAQVPDLISIERKLPDAPSS